MQSHSARGTSLRRDSAAVCLFDWIGGRVRCRTRPPTGVQQAASLLTANPRSARIVHHDSCNSWHLLYDVSARRKRVVEPLMSTKLEATIDDLYHVPENSKAEIVNGKLVLMSRTGGVPARASGEIYISLHDYERPVGGGYAFPDNAGFIVNLSNRRSFSPDAAFYKGELRGGLFLEGAPVFAWKSAARKITDQLPKDGWQPSVPTILQQARWSFGTSTCCARNSCACFARASRRPQPFIEPAKSPKQNPRCRVGRWQWTGFLVESWRGECDPT